MAGLLSAGSFLARLIVVRLSLMAGLLSAGSFLARLIVVRLGCRRD